MSYRVNTLGKAALIDRQLNGAYDIVEYVAQNLPYLLDIVKKIDAIKAITESYAVMNHIENNSIHISQEQVNAINGIADLVTRLELQGTQISSILSTLHTLSTTLHEHINDAEIHVTEEDKTRWNNIAVPTTEQISNIAQGLINTALENYEPEIDISIPVDNRLSDTSENPVQNKVIAQALHDKASSAGLSRVATTGLYKDLLGIPTGDVELNADSTNWVTNSAVTRAIESITGAIDPPGRLTEEEIDTLFEE